MIDITAEDDMPHLGTVWRWQIANPGFREAYTRARELQAHTCAERAVRIGRNSRAETAHADRVQFDAEKWFASRLNPKVYGDKLLHTGADGEGPIAVKLALDYSLLTPQEMVTLRALIEKAKPKVAEPLQIEGEVADE